MLFGISCSSKPVTSEEIQKAKDLSAEGMKIVENWEGRGENLRKAEGFFQEALSLNKQCAPAYTGLGRVALRKGYISGRKYEPKAMERALKYAEKAISLDAQELKAHKLKGSVLALQGNYNDAFKEAEIIEKLDSSSCEPISLRAQIYEFQGKIDESIEELNKELPCQRDDINRTAAIYDGLSNLYFRKKDYDTAAQYSKKVIEMKPESAWAYGNCSRLLIAKGDLDEAEKMAKKAISIMDYGMAHVYLSRIYFKRGEIQLSQGNLDKAENEFLLAAAEYPEDKYAYLKLVYIQLKKGSCDKAVKPAKQVLKIDAEDKYARKAVEHCQKTGKG
jgi:tetratricopeptide (TPR) repeat protein